MSKTILAKSIFIILAITALTSVELVSAAAPYPTTPATATVDGSPIEWDLTADFFADMYRAGDPTKVVESKLYLRYDPATSTLYVLVLTLPTYPGLRDDTGATAWVKIEGTKMVDATFASFEWVEFDPPQPLYVKGFEASFTLLQGEYHTLDVHINVYDAKETTPSQTSRTLKTKINLFVVPEGATIALMAASFAAFGLFAYKRRKTTANILT